MLGTDDPVLRYRGYVAILVGLVLVILARGCDSIGGRNVARLQAKYRLATTDFDEKWDSEERDVTRKIDAMMSSTEPGQVDPKLLDELRKQQSTLATDRSRERRSLESGKWAEMRHDADTAAARNNASAYWRECFFVIGAVILAVGLVVMSVTTPGPERWVALVMLAIIVFSIFVVGSPWLSSMDNALRH
ncbi:MAG: hypothetical protein IT444_13290 [Phycisphaeraceae bacterium]|nr:hypothetical protein [Phycisphaeraceae bacterium]